MRYGKDGAPLKDGKIDLPELLEIPNTVEWSWPRTFVEKWNWREEKTYRETALHDYIVRDWEVDAKGNEDFNLFIIMIRRFGNADFFYKVRHIYWTINEYKYWTMGWPVNETTIINRARVDAAEPWKA